MTRVIAVGVVLSALAGLVPAQTDTRARTREADVRAVLDKQVEAWNRGDLEAFMATYWNSPGLVFQSGDKRTQGWQATLERYRQRYQGQGKEMGRLRFDDVEVQVVGPEAAFVRGRWHLAMKDGSEPNGLFTLLLRRMAGDWKIVHDHTS